MQRRSRRKAGLSMKLMSTSFGIAHRPHPPDEGGRHRRRIALHQGVGGQQAERDQDEGS
jgi:hypothetical protein